MSRATAKWAERPELRIPRKLCQQMLEHARRGAPYEVCGLLAGRGQQVERLYEGSNTERSPVSFFLQPQEQLRFLKDIQARGLQLLAIYHSHPQGTALPSDKDLQVALEQLRLGGWAVVHIIIGLAGPKPQLRGFYLQGEGFQELRLEGF